MSSRPQHRGFSLFRFLVWSAAVCAPLVGTVVLVGWAWDLPSVKSIAPGLPKMAPNTALGLLAGGAALGLLHPLAPGRLRRAVGMTCAWGLILIGAVTLFQYFSGRDLGFDELLFRWAEWASRTPPSPPAPNTAFFFILLGAALLLLGRRAAVSLWWADALVLLALLGALLAFNGYLHGALALTGAPQFFPHTGMGLHTSLTLLLLGVGFLCARPEQGLMGLLTRDTLGGYLARRLAPVGLLGPPVVGVVLELLHRAHIISGPARASLSSTVMSLGGVALVLLSSVALNRIDTERRQSLEHLRAARAEAERERTLLQTVVDSAPVGILFLEPSTDEVRINSALQSLLEMPLEPSAGRQQYLMRLRHTDGRPMRLEDLPSTRAIEGHDVPPEEYLIIHPGRQIPVLASAAPVREASGAVRGVVVSVQDISARQELERLREEYVGLISHDLRTPLQNISLRTQLLLRALRQKELTREAASAESLLLSARRMNEMVEELLEGSRLEAGQAELHREPLDLGHFLEDVIERSVPPDARERVRLEVSGPVPWVTADTPRLERVVVNLLTNALKYGAPGTPVAVRLEHTGTQVQVSVRDQGQGLQPEELSRLFTKYYRTREGRRAKGVGLGLYISRLIVEAHGGHILVESTPGQGSTFTFTLPLREEGEQRASEERAGSHLEPS